MHKIPSPSTFATVAVARKMHQDGTIEEEVNHKDILREAMGTKLAALIPTVDAGMHDLKTEVEK